MVPGTEGTMQINLEVASQNEGYIDRVEITGLDPIIDRICYDGSDFAWQRKLRYESTSLWRRELEYWYKEDTLLDPDTRYCIRAVTTVTNDASSSNAENKSYPPELWLGFFKTGKPPIPIEGSIAYPGGGVLADLSAYVSRTIPEDGSGEKGKHPHYRGYDIGVEFNENYVDLLYIKAAIPLKVRIRDNNGREVGRMVNRWNTLTEPIAGEWERRWRAELNLDNNKPCGSIDWQKVYENVNLLGEGITLQPETLHRADLVAGQSSVVRAFEFTTSKLLNFVSHIHSFQEKVWEVQLDATTDFAKLSGQIATAFKEVKEKVQQVQPLDQNRGALRDKAKNAQINPSDVNFKQYDDALKEWNSRWEDLQQTTSKHFEEISHTLGIIPGSKSVKNIELSILKDSDGSIHTLFFESPEPMDWRRVKVQIDHSTVKPAASLSPYFKLLASSVKISDVQLPEGPNTANPWIELFAFEDAKLDNYTLEVAEDNTTLSSPSSPFTNFFTFPIGTVLNEGKRLRVSPDSVPRDAREIGVEYLSGAKPILAPKNIWIRLLDNDGRLLHQQMIQPSTNYVDQKVFDPFLSIGLVSALFLPNMDGTRALLILIKDQTNPDTIPKEAYLLSFEFRRDVGPEAPVMKQLGYSGPEICNLRFTLE